jgi:hypothetical protein
MNNFLLISATSKQPALFRCLLYIALLIDKRISSYHVKEKPLPGQVTKNNPIWFIYYSPFLKFRVIRSFSVIGYLLNPSVIGCYLSVIRQSFFNPFKSKNPLFIDKIRLKINPSGVSVVF